MKSRPPYLNPDGKTVSDAWAAAYGFTIFAPDGSVARFPALKPDPRASYIPTPKGLDFHESTAPNCLIEGSRGTGKAVRLSTIIPTPHGFRTMASLHVGEWVLDECGRPCRITWKSQSHIDDWGTYRVRFDDGSEIVCGGHHQWWTFDRAERRQRVRRTPQAQAARRARRNRSGKIGHPGNQLPSPHGTVRMTREMAGTIRVHGGTAWAAGEVNYAVPLAAPWQLPEVDLPLDPYVLGVWLGDGTAASGGLTSADGEVINAIVAAGFEVRPHLASDYRWSVCGLAARLRTLGVLGNKHVPQSYLLASPTQRLALLQGLMDTDGSCDARQGTVEFCNTNRQLAESVLILAAGLGLKPTLTVGRATLYGKDCGPKYRVRWTHTLPVFRLSRKLARLPISTRPTQTYRYIITIERVADEPLQCIEVDSPSHLYLVGERGIPTHNSVIIRMDAHMRALSCPGYTYLIIRRTMPELKKTHLRWIGREMSLLGGHWHKTDNIATYHNGSQGFFSHCYDAQTEVLTDRGFVPFPGLRDTDKVATRTPAGRLVFEHPLARQVRHFRGRAVRYQSKGVDLLVTPDHPMLCVDSRGQFVVFPASEAETRPRGRHPLRFSRTAHWKGTEQTTFALTPPLRGRIGRPCDAIPPVPMDEWLEFLGWFLSEGHASQWTRRDGTVVQTVGIAQKKHPTIIARLAGILAGWGLTPHVVKRSDGVQVLSVTQRTLYAQLAQFGKAHEKFVPAFVKTLSPRQIRLFLDALFAGDGTWREGRCVGYTTTSQRLADDVQELLLRVGVPATVGRRRTTPATRKPVWYVSIIHTRRDPCFEPSAVSRPWVDGVFYDVTMPHEPVLLVRRNGRMVWGHNCETEEDMFKLLSSQYDAIYFDEITTFTWEMITKISSCTRVEEGSGKMAVVRGGTNPIGVGAMEVRSHYITKDVLLEDEPDYDPAEYESIHTTMDDNPHIDREQYIRRLSSLPIHIRRAWLDGEWIIEGAYFHDFRAAKGDQPWHVTDEFPRVTPRSGEATYAHRLPWIHVYRTIDWGFSPDPAVCLWIAVLPNGRAFVLKEQTWHSTPARQVAQEIVKASEGWRIVDTYCDPTMFFNEAATEHTSIGDIFEANGVPLTPSVNDRAAAGFAIHEYLSTLLDDGLPKLQIYGPECPMLTRTLPEMRIHKTDPRRIANGNDHWVIALAYFCMGTVGASRETLVNPKPRWMQPHPRAGSGLTRLGSESVRSRAR